MTDACQYLHDTLLRLPRLRPDGGVTAAYWYGDLAPNASGFRRTGL